MSPVGLGGGGDGAMIDASRSLEARALEGLANDLTARAGISARRDAGGLGVAAALRDSAFSRAAGDLGDTAGGEPA